MASPITYNTAKSHVRSILQASRTAYATTVDGSKRQFASDTEIDNAILAADGEVCNIICNTLQHPYQTPFIQTSSALSSGSNLPARNGTVIRVQCVNGTGTVTFTSSEVDATDDVIELGASNAYLAQGLRVQFSNSGGALPAGISAATDYFLYTPDPASPTSFKLSTDPLGGYAGSAIVNITGGGTGTQTLVFQYIDGIETDKNIILSCNENPLTFSKNLYNTIGYYAIEGNTIYTTSPTAKVVYTDYTLTSSPQAPEPYLWAVISGAVARLLKDGGDSETATYYQSIFNQHLQEIASRATVIPQVDQ